MNRFSKFTSDVKVMTVNQDTTWQWISLLFILLAFLGLTLSACSTAPMTEAAVKLPLEISVDEAHQIYQEGVFLLDVRTQEEWDDFHAPNSVHIPLDQLESRHTELPQGEQIAVICRSGNRSQAGRDILLKNGFEAVTSVAGGLNAWREAGYPIE